MSQKELCCDLPVRPSIYMMRDGGGGEDDDVGWQNVEDAAIAVERTRMGSAMRLMSLRLM